MLQENSLETTAKVGVFKGQKEAVGSAKVSDLSAGFLKYARYELCLAEQTVSKYGDSIRWFVRDVGDISVEALTPGHFTELKAKMASRGVGESGVASVVFAMKSFLKYCRNVLRLDVIDQREILPPKRRRREVIFLTNDEVRQFVDSIKIQNRWNGKRKSEGVCMNGLRFRTLVEVLLGTGMRISEVLGLDRDSIDFEKKEAKIIGKGDKERTVFFNQRALEWVRFYLKERKDEAKPLFVTNRLARFARGEVSNLFKRYVRKAGINKKITPHILRHTVATNLLFNGCPISHVKEILGHQYLETTCKFYLGVDREKAKEAHGKFLSF